MSLDEVEILLVEDNPTDAELTIRALKRKNLINKLVWVKDGAEALDFIFAKGIYSKRNVCLLYTSTSISHVVFGSFKHNLII